MTGILRASWLLAVVCTSGSLALYRVGVGIGDTTGPAAGVGTMGYAKQSVTTSGIHTRLYSRAFIFDDGYKRVVFVSLDAGMVGQLVKKKQIEGLCTTRRHRWNQPQEVQIFPYAKQVFGFIKCKVIEELRRRYGKLYTHRNVVISATHTHSGPAGYLQYVLFNITCMGFIKQTFTAMVQGIVKSITRAHDNIQPAHVYLTQGELHGCNINRSPTSYLANPERERQRYANNTDHTVTQLNVISALSGEVMGVINWFAVHGTSLPNTNTLICGDNKGMASLMFEKKINQGQLLGKGPFVAAFASTNLGDASPNIKGAQCRDTGLPCEPGTSTCQGHSYKCVASGPGEDMWDSAKITAERQFSKAYALYKDLSGYKELTGTVASIHQWIDMSNRAVLLPNGKMVKTCPPALGYSFAAGTTDGPGEFDFTQGTKSRNIFWNTITNAIHKPSREEAICQSPKPILLDTGAMKYPYDWSPTIVDTQIIRIGSFLVLAVPGEFTTMAGRRLRETVYKEAVDRGAPTDTQVVLAGLSNTYSHYVTTYEEYQEQRYEAASTLYGPHTLMAYQQQYEWLAKALYQDVPLGTGKPPPDLSKKQISVDVSNLMDSSPMDRDYGDCTQQPDEVVFPGEVVQARFVSGHPRNHLKLEETFLSVERLEPQTKVWVVIATDADLETKFKWRRTMLTESEATVLWEIPLSQEPGVYRLTHSGHYKSSLGATPRPFVGKSNSFKILPNTPVLRRQRLERRRRVRHGKGIHGSNTSSTSNFRRDDNMFHSLAVLLRNKIGAIFG